MTVLFPLSHVCQVFFDKEYGRARICFDLKNFSCFIHFVCFKSVFFLFVILPTHEVHLFFLNCHILVVLGKFSQQLSFCFLIFSSFILFILYVIYLLKCKHPYSGNPNSSCQCIHLNICSSFCKLSFICRLIFRKTRFCYIWLYIKKN